ncbi:MAG: sialate O-acetylesterase [Mangrovibacterium sp.]
MGSIIITLVQTSGQVETGSHRLKLQLYLLIGQSNMAGRGVLEVQDTIAPDRRIFRKPGSNHVDPNSYQMMIRSKDSESWTKEPELINAK